MTAQIRAFLTACIFLIGVSAFAEKSDSVRSLTKDLEEAKNQVAREEQKQRKILSYLFRINKKMKKIVSEKAKLDEEKLGLEANNRLLAQRIVLLDVRVKSQKQLLRERLAAIYKFGGQGWARVIFSSADSSHLERNLRILGMVAKRDLDLIRNYSSMVKELEAKKAKLTQRLAHLKRIEEKIRSKEQNLIAEISYRNKILDAIRKSHKFAMTKVSSLKEKVQQMVGEDDSGVLDLLYRPSFYEQKGRLPLPAKGQIAQSYGLIRDEQHNVTLSHKGIFIETPASAPVSAVFDGKVAFVGPIDGFGSTLIVDHGDHYYTVYSHAKNITVKVGEEVKKNQRVASAGFAHEPSLHGVYFEVRHFSEPYNPKNWMKESSL